MEDANGGLSILEGYIPIVGRKRKTTSDYEGRRMGFFLQKGTRNNTAMFGFVGGFQYLKRKENRECDERIG